MLQPRIPRGRYGGYPEAVVPRQMIWRARIYALAVGLLAGLRLQSHGQMLRDITDDERLIIEDARSRVEFAFVPIDRGLRGFQLNSCESVPGYRDVVTLNFRAVNEFSIADNVVSLTQRKGWLPLHEELMLAHVPFTRIRDGRGECYLVHGVYGGEPIDHAYWYRTQHSLTFEVAGIVCELREQIGRGPGLATLLAFARRIEEAASNKMQIASVFVASQEPGRAAHQART